VQENEISNLRDIITVQSFDLNKKSIQTLKAKQNISLLTNQLETLKTDKQIDLLTSENKCEEKLLGQTENFQNESKISSLKLAQATSDLSFLKDQINNGPKMSVICSNGTVCFETFQDRACYYYQCSYPSSMDPYPCVYDEHKCELEYAYCFFFSLLSDLDMQKSGSFTSSAIDGSLASRPANDFRSVVASYSNLLRRLYTTNPDCSDDCPDLPPENVQKC